MTNLKLPRQRIIETVKRLMEPENTQLRELLIRMCTEDAQWNNEADDGDNLAEYIYQRFLKVHYNAAWNIFGLEVKEPALRLAMNPPMGGEYWWEWPIASQDEESTDGIVCLGGDHLTQETPSTNSEQNTRLQPSCFVIHRLPQPTGLLELRIAEYHSEQVDSEQLLAQGDLLPGPDDIFEYWLEAKIGLINQLEALAKGHGQAGDTEAVDYYSAQAATWKTMKLNDNPMLGFPTVSKSRGSDERREAIVIDAFEIEHEPGNISEYAIYTYEVTYLDSRAFFNPRVARHDEHGYHTPEGDEAMRVMAYLATHSSYKPYRAAFEE